MVLPTILYNFQCVSFIRYSNEKSELKTHNWNIGVHIFCLNTFITSAEREVKDSRRSGMYQSYNFLTRLGKQSLQVFGSIRLFDEVRAELVRDISRSLRFLWFILYLFQGRKNYHFGFPGVWTDSPVWPVSSEETLSWGISRLRYCDPRLFGRWKKVMKWCTSFGTRLGVQVRDFSACFNYFTKWDRTTSWYLEITSTLVFNYSRNK